MSILSDNEILAVLDDLDSCCAGELESKWLDFKKWEDQKASRRLAVEMAVCFANAEGGVVVFGVDDKLVGKAGAIHGTEEVNEDDWRKSVYDGTRLGIDVEVSQVAVNEGTGRLLIMRVPKSTDGPHGTVKGLFQRRVGKNCKPLDPQRWMKTRVATGALDWSGEFARDITADDLDPFELERSS